LTEADEPHAIETLCDLLDEFLAEMRWNGARERLFHEYWVWQQSQSWYDADLVRYSMSPAPDGLTVDEVAELLGITRNDVFDLIASWKLKPRREGSEVRLRTSEVEKYKTKTPEDRAAHRVDMFIDFGDDE
jgi:excisionase family DNA binding protein